MPVFFDFSPAVLLWPGVQRNSAAVIIDLNWLAIEQGLGTRIVALRVFAPHSFVFQIRPIRSSKGNESEMFVALVICGFARWLPLATAMTGAAKLRRTVKHISYGCSHLGLCPSRILQLSVLNF